MKKLILEPDGWQSSLEDCPPGLFLSDSKYICFKTEYRTEDGRIEAYNEAGEFYCGDRSNVQPLKYRWEGVNEND